MGGRSHNVQTLTQTYWTVFQEEGPIELEEFLKQVKEGRHGEHSPKEIDDFIDEVLGTILANIQLKATEAPHYAARQEEVEQETYARMARLKREYGSG